MGCVEQNAWCRGGRPNSGFADRGYSYIIGIILRRCSFDKFGRPTAIQRRSREVRHGSAYKQRVGGREISTHVVPRGGACEALSHLAESRPKAAEAKEARAGAALEGRDKRREN